MNSTEQKIAVMQAYIRGKKIECHRRNVADPEWQDTSFPSWDWATWEYRVKPETVTIFRVFYADGSIWETLDRKAAVSRWCDAQEHGLSATLQSREI